MADRRPLVHLADGSVSEMQAGDTVPADALPDSVVTKDASGAAEATSMSLTSAFTKQVHNLSWLGVGPNEQAYRLATFAPSSASQYGSLYISGHYGDWYASAKYPYRLLIANRDSLTVRFLEGFAYQNASLRVYREADGSYSVWVVILAASFCVLSVDFARIMQGNLESSPPSGTPAGDLLFSTAYATPLVDWRGEYFSAPMITNRGVMGGAFFVPNHFCQPNVGTAEAAFGWIAAAFGDDTAARVVVGQFGGQAVVGAHNNTLSLWAPLSVYYADEVGFRLGGTGQYAMALRGDRGVVVGGNELVYDVAGRGNVTVNGNDTAIVAFRTSGAGRGFLYHDGSAMSLSNTQVGPLVFSTGDVERARIDATGNMGIGIAPAPWNGSQVALQVGTGFSVNASKNNAASFSLTQGAVYDTSGVFRLTWAGIPASRFDQVSGVFVWSTAPAGAAGATANFATLMQLDAGGLYANVPVHSVTPLYGDSSTKTATTAYCDQFTKKDTASGGVGAYGLFVNNGAGSLAAGDLVAGSNLYEKVGPNALGGSPPGTWRAMGYVAGTSVTMSVIDRVGLFLRLS